MFTPIGRSSMPDIPELSGVESAKQTQGTPQLKGSSIPKEGAASQAAVPKAVTPSTGRAAIWEAAKQARLSEAKGKLEVATQTLDEMKGSVKTRHLDIAKKLQYLTSPKGLNIFDRIIYQLNKGKIENAKDLLKQEREVGLLKSHVDKLEKEPELEMLGDIRGAIRDDASPIDLLKFVIKNFPDKSSNYSETVNRLLEDLTSHFGQNAYKMSPAEKQEMPNLYNQLYEALPSGIRLQCNENLNRFERYINHEAGIETPSPPVQQKQAAPQQPAVPTAKPSEEKPAAPATPQRAEGPRKPLPTPTPKPKTPTESPTPDTQAAATSAPARSKPLPTPKPKEPAAQTSQPQAASRVGRPQQSLPLKLEYRQEYAVLERVLGREPDLYECKAVRIYLDKGLGEEIAKLDRDNVSVANGFTQALNKALTQVHIDAIKELLKSL